MAQASESPPRSFRVLVSFPWSVTAGGGQYTAIAMANTLSRRGHKVSYCSDTGPALQKLDREVAFYRAPASLAYIRKRLFPFWPSSIFRFLRAVADSRVELVHAYCAPSFVLACMAKVLRGTPCLYSELGPSLPPYEVCRLAEKIIVCSEELRDKLSTQYGLRKERIIVIPNHIETSVYRPGLDTTEFMTRFELDPEAKRIVVVGRVTHSKYGTIQSVLKAVPDVLKSVPKLEVIIVGTGELMEKAHQDVSQLNEAGGRRIGILTGAILDVPQMLNLADIVVGIGRSALEGMACRKPTLIIGQNGYAGTVCPEMARELAHFNFAGRNITQPSSPDLLVKAIVWILSDAAYADAVGEFGRQYIEEHVSAEKDAKQLEKLYLETVNHNSDGAWARFRLLLQLLKMMLSRLWFPSRLLRKLGGPVRPQNEGMPA